MRSAQQRAAKLLVMGIPVDRVAKMVGVTRQTIHAWSQLEEFRLLKEQIAEENQMLLEELLLEGEKEAAKTVLEALQANSDDKVNWDVRLKAAFRLLDAMGRRGKPVDKVESKHTELSGNLNDLLTQLMRDPGVRGYIERLQPVPPVLDATLEESPEEDKGEQVDFETYDDKRADTGPTPHSGDGEAGPIPLQGIQE